MKLKSQRICFVVPTMGVGGTERQLLLLMEGLAPDHELIVVCTRDAGAMAGEVRRLGRLRTLDCISGWDFRVGARAYDVFTAYRPTIVHSFMFGFDYRINKAARKAGVRAVLSSRRQLATWKSGRHIRVQKKGNRLVDAVVANSRAVADFAIDQESADPGLFRMIPNGLNADAFVSDRDVRQIRKRYRIPFHTHVVGMVANFSPVKDHKLFVEIAAILVKKRADVHFVLVGNGPLRDTVRTAIEKKKLLDRFKGISTISELADLYRVMSVSVLTSHVEGFPNVILESMAAGTPVVAAKVGGIPELIEDGVTGSLISTRSPNDFAEAVDAILSDTERSAAMAERAQARVHTEFGTAQLVERHTKLYAELLARTGRT